MAALLERLTNLKVISQTGSGAAHVDREACRRHSVTVMAGTGALKTVTTTAALPIVLAL